jgi:hypothetical protein
MQDELTRDKNRFLASLGMTSDGWAAPFFNIGWLPLIAAVIVALGPPWQAKRSILFPFKARFSFNSSSRAKRGICFSHGRKSRSLAAFGMTGLSRSA